VTRRFVELASRMLSLALLPLTLGIALDSCLLVKMVTHLRAPATAGALLIVLILGGLWFVLPFVLGWRRPKD
jgi:hypothetical protein